MLGHTALCFPQPPSLFLRQMEEVTKMTKEYPLLLNYQEELPVPTNTNNSALTTHLHPRHRTTQKGWGRGETPQHDPSEDKKHKGGRPVWAAMPKVTWESLLGPRS